MSLKILYTKYIKSILSLNLSISPRVNHVQRHISHHTFLPIHIKKNSPMRQQNRSFNHRARRVASDAARMSGRSSSSGPWEVCLGGSSHAAWLSAALQSVHPPRQQGVLGRAIHHRAERMPEGAILTRDSPDAHGNPGQERPRQHRPVPSSRPQKSCERKSSSSWQLTRFP